MKQIKNKIITAFFCVFLAAVAVVPIVAPDKYYSESEKRTLSQADGVKITEFFSGKFQSSLDKYLSDQFPLRDGFVTVKTLADLAVGKREINGVYFSKDGYLIQNFSSVDEKNFSSNAEAVKKISSYAEAVGASFAMIPVPTAACVLGDKLPAFAPHADEKELISALTKSGIAVIDVAGALLGHSSEYIYYRTDHHFTSLGAYYAYKAYREGLALSVSPLSEYTQETLSDEFFGTSQNKVNYPFAKSDTLTACYKTKNHRVSYNGGEYVSDSLYERAYLAGRDKYAVYLNSNQAETVIEGNGEGKLLLIKDSYGNTFAQFPAEDYAEVHMLDLRFFKKSVKEYIKENGITDVAVIYGLSNFANDVKIALTE